MTFTLRPMTICHNFDMFGEWLDKQLKKKGWSGYKLAGKIDVDPSYINHLIHNRRNPSNDLIEKIAEALGLPPEEVYIAAGSKLTKKSPNEKSLERLYYRLSKLGEDDLSKAESFVNYLYESNEGTGKSDGENQGKAKEVD